MIRRMLFNLICAYVRNTPPHPGRGVLMRLAGRIYPHEFIAEIEGVKLRLNSQRAYDLGVLCGTWEEHDEHRVLCSYLRPGMTVIDIGAHIGVYSLLMAKVVGPTGCVYAFEPVPQFYERLLANIALNEATNIKPFQIAISDESGEIEFFVSLPHLFASFDEGGSSIFPYTPAHSQSIKVLTETLDSFLERQGIERVDAIKIDVEGAELKVIRGAKNLLSRPDKPLLMLEVNPSALRAAGTTPEELFSEVLSFGYEPFVIFKGQLIPCETVVVTSKDWWTKIELSNYLFKPPDWGRRW